MEELKLEPLSLKLLHFSVQNIFVPNSLHCVVIFLCFFFLGGGEKEEVGMRWLCRRGEIGVEIII